MDSAVPSLGAAVSSSAATLAASIMASLEPAIDAFHRVPGSAIVLRYVKSSYQNDPIRSLIELFLFLFAVRYLLSPKYSTSRKLVTEELTEGEIDELIEEWVPEPLVSDLTDLEKKELLNSPIITSNPAPKVKIASSKVSLINLSNEDCYNLAASDRLKSNAIHALREYGVGPCGPPGFYGTQDVHIKAEEDVAEHLKTEACIIYAQSFSTISSVIPAFCKRGDVIVADRALSFSALKGLQASRSTVHWYKHNDMKDLEAILAKVEREQKAKKILTRRFIITEALFENTGNIADLLSIIKLKEQYKFRLILDEKNSYGVLGVTGRGLTEEVNVDSTKVDMIVGSLSGTICTAGGFCAGSREIVYHQRINALSYCYSAALPAMMATAASEIISLLKSEEGTQLMSKLRENARTFRAYFDRHPDPVVCQGWVENPMILLTLAPKVVAQRGWDAITLDDFFSKVVVECQNKGVLVSRCRALPTPPDTKESDLIRSGSPWRPQPAIRARISVSLTKRELESAAATIRTVIKSTLSSFQPGR